MRKAVPIILVILIAIAAGYYFYAQFTYSEGNRAGRLIKFSKKGFAFKTYEGELNLGGVNTDMKNGLVNNMWQFSVIDPTVADTLMTMEGKDVTLHYKQVVKNFSWQGETSYFVDKAEQQVK